LDEITVEREGQDFILTVHTRRPAGDIACTMALVPFEETVSLDVEGLEAGTYTIIAQEQEATFTLEVDNEISE
jgi:inhibitor of cysteine peptidase